MEGFNEFLERCEKIGNKCNKHEFTDGSVVSYKSLTWAFFLQMDFLVL